MARGQAKIAVVVVGYWVVSISMVFSNKHLLGRRDNHQHGDISLFVAWIQCTVTVMLIGLQSIAKAVRQNDCSALAGIHDNGPFVRPIMTMSSVFVAMLTFNNLCLKNVDIAFYQVAGGLTLIFVVIFSVIILKQRVSMKAMGCCLCVAAGFVLGVDQEHYAGSLTLSGVMFGVVHSLFVSLNGIFTTTALDAVKHDSIKLTFYNNINAVILFSPLVLLTGQLTTVMSSPHLHNATFWLSLLGSGGLGFLVGLISAMQISLTSPLTHHISCNTKAVVQTLVAVLLAPGGEPRRPRPVLWWVALLLVVAGATGYALLRMQPTSQKQTRSLAARKRKKIVI